MEFKVVTPHGVTYNDTIEKVTVPTLAGALTILDQHAPIVSVLAAGEMVIHRMDGSTVDVAVSGGIMEIVSSGAVYIMADTAERAEEIDISRAEAAKKRAEELLTQQKNIADVDFARIQASIEKELARISIGKKYRKL
ncbi:MAG: ATP synthase F1 subunit epsilon [Candidatus Magasanikbacteria bacterium CG10_big_fil_rev_8_21_14_0_10_47_10]|uniref:ATP synthase epsilon chain n=1 Tax=Candidatus Magasanikbacteria bacterium CG10_big_fil_rev_8_21_14_0_10_47_10 TaxID=1974652 RepID=A0A2H0TQG0_9BACT|nr:MAG: ATP synthase F1 subunit epsilon [Candidatus Magasanikbacteria bacterium CG10_big_fil_rev_8_21_14_0_10_47_10]